MQLYIFAAAYEYCGKLGATTTVRWTRESKTLAAHHGSGQSAMDSMDTRAEMLAAYEMPPPTALCNLGARRSTTPLRLSRLSAGHCANEAEPAPASKGLFRSLPDMRIPPYRGGRDPDEFATVFANRTSWLRLTQQDINPSTPPESPRQHQRRTPYDSPCAYSPGGTMMASSVDVPTVKALRVPETVRPTVSARSPRPSKLPGLRASPSSPQSPPISSTRSAVAARPSKVRLADLRKASPSTDREPASAKSQGGTSAGSSATIWLQNLPSPEGGSSPQASQQAQPAGWAVLRHAHEAQVLADAQTNEEKWSALAKPWLRKYDKAQRVPDYLDKLKEARAEMKDLEDKTEARNKFLDAKAHKMLDELQFLVSRQIQKTHAAHKSQNDLRRLSEWISSQGRSRITSPSLVDRIAVTHKVMVRDLFHEMDVSTLPDLVAFVCSLANPKCIAG